MGVQIVEPGVVYTADEEIQRSYQVATIMSPEGFFFSWVKAVIFSRVTYISESPDKFLNLELEVQQVSLNGKVEMNVGKDIAEVLCQKMIAKPLIVNSAAVHEMFISTARSSFSDRRIAGMDSFIL